MSSVYNIERFDIPQVHSRHLDNIFADVRYTIDTRLWIIERDKPTPFYECFCKSLRAFRDHINASDYSAFQQKWLRPNSLGSDTSFLKFLDVPFWLEAKMRIAWRLKLHKVAPMKICDLGMGCGHFAWLAVHLGHPTVGLDLPAGTSPVSEMYAEYRNLLGCVCVDHAIKPQHSLTKLDSRFELITGLLVNFNGDGAGMTWQQKDWDFFLKDIEKNLLEPNGLLFLQLTDNLTGPEVWEYLKRRSNWFLDQSKQITFAADGLGMATPKEDRILLDGAGQPGFGLARPNG